MLLTKMADCTHLEKDYKTRVEEARQADFLFGMNKLYPHAWYCRLVTA